MSQDTMPVAVATQKQYLSDPRTFAGTARIVEIIDGERPIIRLESTWFHPQGGGQKADRGRICTAQVLHVSHNASQVDHFVDSTSGLHPGMTVDFEIDVAWRALNAAYHTAGHLIACIGEALAPGVKAIAGHQWPGEARVEFDAAPTAAAHLTVQMFNDQLTADVTRNLGVEIKGEPFANRSIQIGGYTAIPCGGTHVTSLQDVAGVKVLALKTKSGRLRVSYEIDSASTTI